jgi:hypothetical protein
MILIKSQSDGIADNPIQFTYRGNSKFISTGGSRRGWKQLKTECLLAMRLEDYDTDKEAVPKLK